MALLEKKCKNKSIDEQNILQIKKPTGGSYKINIPNQGGDKFYVIQTYNTTEINEV